MRIPGDAVHLQFQRAGGRECLTAMPTKENSSTIHWQNGSPLRLAAASFNEFHGRRARWANEWGQNEGIIYTLLSASNQYHRSARCRKIKVPSCSWNIEAGSRRVGTTLEVARAAARGPSSRFVGNLHGGLGGGFGIVDTEADERASRGARPEQAGVVAVPVGAAGNPDYRFAASRAYPGRPSLVSYYR
jgi:hypothetical protein